MNIDSKQIERTIGANVKIYREALGMTAETLGAAVTEALGLEPWPRQTIYGMEKGRRAFRIGELLALAKCLSVKVEDLFRAVDFSEPAPVVKTKSPQELLNEVKADRPVTWSELLGKV